MTHTARVEMYGGSSPSSAAPRAAFQPRRGQHWDWLARTPSHPCPAPARSQHLRRRSANALIPRGLRCPRSRGGRRHSLPLQVARPLEPPYLPYLHPPRPGPQPQPPRAAAQRPTGALGLLGAVALPGAARHPKSRPLDRGPAHAQHKRACEHLEPTRAPEHRGRAAKRGLERSARATRAMADPHQRTKALLALLASLLFSMPAPTP